MNLKAAILEETKRFEEVYHWLENSYSELFFQEMPASFISLIVHSLMGFKQQEYFSEIHLKGAAIALTLDSIDADVKILENFAFFGIKNYTTYVSKLPFPGTSNSLRIASLTFTNPFLEKIESYPDERKEELLGAIKKKESNWDEKILSETLAKVDYRFLRSLPLERQALALETFKRAKTRDLCQYEVEYEKQWQEKKSYSMHLTLAWKNTPRHNFLYRLARLILNHNLVIQRVHGIYVDPYKKEGILLLSFDLHGAHNEAAWEAADIEDFLQELVTLNFFGSLDTFDEVFVQKKLLRGNLANLLRTMRYFIHQMLVHIDPNLYRLKNIEEALTRHTELTQKMVAAFEAKFDPKNADLKRFEKIKEEFLQAVNAIDTGDEYNDKRRKNVFFQAMHFVEYTLKTNFYKKNKSSFAFRVDPKILDTLPFDRKALFPELPFGIFFLKGMHYFGFHIRFKDLSRGGLRTVIPDSQEKALVEMNSVFLECYNLAYTQHKKNKDIPEGGAKGVIFLKPNIKLEEECHILRQELKEANIAEEEIENRISIYKDEQKLEYLYQIQRSYIKSFLSLINCYPDGKLKAKDIVDYWRKAEYIYLGPDENMHDVMIEWIASESTKEEYKPKGAFISGKPKMGINHKEYGVTSLGVNVYMEEILKFIGIDPYTQSFTVKMTGGPDGDVAGNQIHNLYTHFPKTAKIVALTDVSGTIYDPHGLDLKECDTLFREGKSIRYFPHDKLSEAGFLLDKMTKKEVSPYAFQTLFVTKKGTKIEENWLSGNEMNALYRHNVHVAKADIFLPCGGRPRTLRESNWEEFLDDTGAPTAKAIVEGANLYLTQKARRFLEEKGVLIIKDSSANKGGVITSSFEILCGLVLENGEFLKNKEVLVKEILERVKTLSLNEARLLLDTYREKGGFLTDISEEISQKINKYTDELLAYFEKISLSDDPSDPLSLCILNYAPATLRKYFSQKLLKEVPENHRKAIIATSIASKLVYERGLSWAPSLIDILPLILQI